MIDLGLNDKRAVVVGAGYRPDRAGHGRGSALNLAEAGARVACVDIDPGRAEAVAAEIAEAGGTAFVIIADVTDSQQATRAIDEAADVLGGLDVCVDVVGGSRWGLAYDLSDEDWDWTLSNNLSHVFYVYRAAARHMIAQGTGGALACLSSVDGIQSAALHMHYGAAKAALISLTRTFADELGPHGIRVNAVAPGNVGYGNWDVPDVPFGADPVNSLAPPRGIDVANAILFLSSALAARITGQTLVVDGGALIKSRWGYTPTDLKDLNDA
jgi:NAD(P)-dependent dehydrogenase (short-subunit alcohol dehydrogenase family)